MRLGWIALAAFALASDAAAAAKAPAWTKFADCAAYYRVNGRLAAVDRGAAMSAQMTDLADSYAKTALARYRLQKKATPQAAEHAVNARIAAGVERMGPKPPRLTLERLIDKCPQPDG